MRKVILLTVLFFTAMVYAQPYQYPVTKSVEVSDNYFGKIIKDPYRWLENVKEEEVTNWFRSQADFTNGVLKQIPGVETLVKEIEELRKINTKVFYPYAKRGETWYFNRRLPGEQIDKLYSRIGDGGEDNLLFDPENFVKDKIFSYEIDINSDGTYMLLFLSEQGKEIGDLYVMDLISGQMLEIFKYAAGLFSKSDPRVFYYVQTNSNDVYDMQRIMDNKVMMHRIGTEKKEDKIIASRLTNPELNLKQEDLGMVLTFKESPYAFFIKGDSGPDLKIDFTEEKALNQGTSNWKSLSKKEDKIKSVYDELLILNGFISRGNDLYIISQKNNDLGSVIKMSINDSDFSVGQEIIAGKDDWQIEGLSETQDFLLIAMSKNSLNWTYYKYEFNTGKLSELKVPLSGTLFAMPQAENKIILVHAGWTEPRNLFSYDLDSDVFSNGPFYIDVNYPGTEHLISKTIEVPSHDGTMVPMTLIYDEKKLKQDGSNICLLNGYGSYGISQTPYFFYSYLPLLKRGGILAFAHVRGGGEKGRAWHLAGQKTNKPNTWKDFNACAEYLIQNKFTSVEKLGCTGGSAGGILIGRAITERPDLYKVAIPSVGALNMLRMENSPNGPANVPEFGTVKDSIECMALIEMDAMTHVKKSTNYPAQLIKTGFNDPRVASWIPAKFAAAMQNANTSANPVLLDVNYNAGHFGGTTVDEKNQEIAREIAFLLWQCGHPEFQPIKTSVNNGK